jgi:hypothetical protein
LVKRAKPFTLKNDELCRIGQDNKLGRCLTTTKAQMMMKELHEGPSRGHFTIEKMQKKRLVANYVHGHA